MSIGQYPMVLYIAGNSVAAFFDGERIAHRTLFRHHHPAKHNERRMRIRMRVREVLNQVWHAGYRTGGVRVVFGAPWVSYQVHHVQHARSESFQFTPELEKTLVEEEYAQAERIRAHSDPGDNWALLNARVGQHELNGYAVVDPYDQQAHRVAASVVFSYADVGLMRDVRASIRTYLQTDNYYLESYWQWLAHHRECAPHGVYLLVGSYETDVVWVQDGFPRAFDRINFGTHDTELDLDILARAVTPTLHQWAHDDALPHRLYAVYDELGAQHGQHDPACVHHACIRVPYLSRDAAIETAVFPEYSLFEQDL